MSERTKQLSDLFFSQRPKKRKATSVEEFIIRYFFSPVDEAPFLVLGIISTRRDYTWFPSFSFTIECDLDAVGSSSQGVLTSFVCDTNTRQLEDVDAMISHHCTNTALINGLDCTFDFTASILTCKTQNHERNVFIPLSSKLLTIHNVEIPKCCKPLKEQRSK